MMRKITSLLLMALLLATMLTVFTVPVSAENVDYSDKKVITGPAQYDELNVYGLLVVDTEGELTVNKLIIKSYGSLMLKPGAKIKAKKITVQSAVLSVPSGATIEVEDEFDHGDCTTLEPGATLKAKTLFGGKTLTVCSGATLIASEMYNCGNIDLYGTLKSPEGTFFKAKSVNVSYHNGALLDVTCENNEMAKQIAMFAGLETEKIEGNRVYKHTHTFNCPCVNCGVKPGASGSALSEGSLTIIVGVACLAVGFLAAMFIFKKKKKPALASGEDKDEE